MKNSFIILLLLAYQIFVNNLECYGQKNNVEKISSLQEFGLVEYPEFEQVQNSIFDKSDLILSALSQKDINTDFSNFEDLNWLKNIARSHKVILLGENHYFKYIHNLRNRIFFALNVYDYYPLIILEQQYSKTPFINHFLMIKDDELAKEYEAEIYDLISNESEYSLLKHIRRWNKNNPEKLLRVGYTDIEHDYKTTINKILIPYFEIIDSSLVSLVVNEERDIKELLPKLDSLLLVAKEENLYGKYPFISPQYIHNVIENLRSIYYSTFYESSFYRQKAIIRNLTNPNFLGDYLVNGKVLIHGGSYHTPTHFPYPEGGNFLREGSYLTFENKNTMDKTYSITFEGLAYSLSQMYNINLSSCLHSGGGYADIVRRMQNAYTQGLLDTSKHYFKFDFNIQDDAFLKHVIKEAYNKNNQPLRLTSVSWEKMLEKSYDESSLLYKSIKNQKEKIKKYDSFIFVPQSPVTKAREKIENFRSERKITFKVISKIFPDSSVYITGNHVKLGNWNPGVVELSKQKDGSWGKTILFEEGTNVEFKITRGSWFKEVVGIDGQIPSNSTLSVKGDSTITIVVENWKDRVE